MRSSLAGCIDSVLSIRECMGAQLSDVHLITRTWSGERVGDGIFSDEVVKMSPTPKIKDYSHDIRVSEAGAVKQGDLILVGISRNSYPDEKLLRTEVDSIKQEKMIKVGRHFYRTIHVREKLVTWDLHIRKIGQDETEKET